MSYVKVYDLCGAEVIITNKWDLYPCQLRELFCGWWRSRHNSVILLVHGTDIYIGIDSYGYLGIKTDKTEIADVWIRSGGFTSAVIHIYKIEAIKEILNFKYIDYDRSEKEITAIQRNKEQIMKIVKEALSKN